MHAYNLSYKKKKKKTQRLTIIRILARIKNVNTEWGGPSTYVYCVVNYHVTAAPWIRKVDLCLCILKLLLIIWDAPVIWSSFIFIYFLPESESPSGFILGLCLPKTSLHEGEGHTSIATTRGHLGTDHTWAWKPPPGVILGLSLHESECYHQGSTYDWAYLYHEKPHQGSSWNWAFLRLKTTTRGAWKPPVGVILRLSLPKSEGHISISTTRCCLGTELLTQGRIWQHASIKMQN